MKEVSEGKEDETNDNQAIGIACLSCQGQLGECSDLKDSIIDVYPECGYGWCLDNIEMLDTKEDGTIGLTMKRRKKEDNPDCERSVRPHHKSKVVSLERDSVNHIIVPLERDIDRPGAMADTGMKRNARSALKMLKTTRERYRI